MKAVGWTTWERDLPSAKVQTRTGAASICLKPWDQILPEEGVAERMADAKNTLEDMGEISTLGSS